jgi:diguanylate cyclase (GGDEF)-like protein
MKDRAGEFEQLSVTDSLTGLLNRRYLQERLSEEIQRSKRHHFPMSLLMLDVDNFKSYNDTYGHLAGDAALRIVASILKDNLRGDDVAARYGGEEFAVLLPQTSSEEASVIAERIRMQIERTPFPHRHITASIGIAKTTPDVNSPDDIIWAADRALYEAKDRGRNNVQLYSDFGDSLAEKIH